MAELTLRDGVLAIHTSDRLAYKRCRRKWKWSSRLYDHLRPANESPAPLWFGTGFHFALEDLHGYNKFNNSPEEAFLAYVDAHPEGKRPETWRELIDLGIGMLSHYQTWLHRRDTYKTVWIGDVPQVEVQFNILIPELTEYVAKNWDYLAPHFGLDPNEVEPPQVVYRGTFDRIVQDDIGKYWILDYKTAATIDTSKLETDPQITSYVWAANKVYAPYGIQFEGVVYLQCKKDFPQQPEPLKSGGISADERQKTNYTLYRQALIENYGLLNQAPKKNQEFLDALMDMEEPDSDKFIRRDVVRRNESFVAAEHAKIVMEGYEMLNPELYIYPNPTRDCSWDCPFKSACIAYDDGSDYQYILDEEFVVKEDEEFKWQDRIQYPNQQQEQQQVK